jgi:hypothetical protein
MGLTGQMLMNNPQFRAAFEKKYGKDKAENSAAAQKIKTAGRTQSSGLMGIPAPPVAQRMMDEKLKIRREGGRASRIRNMNR